METVGERSVSGRTLVIAALVVMAAVTATSVVFGPGLREQVRQEQRPRTLREPIASGTHEGQIWEAVGHYDGTANCVELRYRGDVLGKACDAGPRVTATALPSGGPTIAYGVAPESATQHDVRLDDGTSVTTSVTAGDLGFPVGFWAVELPPGATLAEGGT